jgi:NADH dehydrogenase [ubiquinone] 1 alpha subcomplex assembly factor 7
MNTALEEIIIDTIKARGKDGFMRLDEYMSLCLSHPEYGYYMTHDPLGEAGDFTTAPEISQMFGEMIGAWLADTWIKMGAPAKINITECGAGRGTLMADALRATKGVEGFHNAVHLHIIEISPVLKKQQQEGLKAYDATWHSDTESLPTDSPHLIIGNEFLDALPVRQFVFTDTGWAEKIIKIDINDTMCLYEIALDEKAEKLIPTLLIPPKIGDHLEVSLEQNEFINQVSKIILNQGGNTLFLDYGFIHNVAGDTLQAVKNHQYCGVLESSGEADLTAHVNFSKITEEIMANGLTVHGPVSQADFLKRLGIEARAEILSQHATDKQRVDLGLALKRLTGEKTQDGEMGALFKVIAFSSDPQSNLAGFS